MDEGVYGIHIGCLTGINVGSFVGIDVGISDVGLGDRILCMYKRMQRIL